MMPSPSACNDGQDTSNLAMVSISVLAANDQPSANAGGPYEGVEGSPVELDGRKSADPESGDLTFAWDPDYDGSTFAPDPALSGPRPTYIYRDDTRTQVGLQVSDGETLSEHRRRNCAHRQCRSRRRGRRQRADHRGSIV